MESVPSVEKVNGQEWSETKVRADSLAHVRDVVQAYKSTSSLCDLDSALSAAIGFHLRFPDQSREAIESIQLEGYLIGQCFIRTKSIDDLVMFLNMGIKLCSQHLGILPDVEPDRQYYSGAYQKLAVYFVRLCRITPETPPQKAATFDWLCLAAAEIKHILDDDFLAALLKLTELSTELEVTLEATADSPQESQKLAQERADQVAKFSAILPGVTSSKCRVRISGNDLPRWGSSRGPPIRGLAGVSRLIRQGCISVQAGDEDVDPFVRALGSLSELCERHYANDMSIECFSLAEEMLEMAILTVESTREKYTRYKAAGHTANNSRWDTKAYAHARMASVLRGRHMATGSEEAAKEACSHAERAVALSSEDNSSYKLLLGLCHKARYRTSDDINELDKAIEILRSIRPGSGQYELQTALASELGLMLRLQSTRSGSTDSLNEAIAMMRAIVELSKPELLLDGRVYNNLALCLQLRYNRNKDLADAKEAISYLEGALKNLGSAPDSGNSAVRSGILCNLSNSYCEQFKRSRRREDIDRAIEYGEEAMRLMPAAGVQQFAVANDFGEVLEQKYELTKDPTDLDRAVEQARLAFSFVRRGHIYRSAVVRTLTRMLRLQATIRPHLAANNTSECLALQCDVRED